MLKPESCEAKLHCITNLMSRKPMEVHEFIQFRVAKSAFQVESGGCVFVYDDGREGAMWYEDFYNKAAMCLAGNDEGAQFMIAFFVAGRQSSQAWAATRVENIYKNEAPF